MNRLSPGIPPLRYGMAGATNNRRPCRGALCECDRWCVLAVENNGVSAMNRRTTHALDMVEFIRAHPYAFGSGMYRGNLGPVQ